MQKYTFIPFQPVLYFFVLMRGIIINDNMQLFVLVSLTFNLLEEFEKLFVRVLLVTLTGHATRGNIECCKKWLVPFLL